MREACEVTELKTLPIDCSHLEVFDALRSDGGVIVENLLDPAIVDEIVNDFAPAFAASAPGSKSDEEVWQTFHGATTKRFCGLAGKSRAWVDHVLLNPLLLAVADEFLLPAASDYWLNTGQVMAVGPGEPAQYLHRDENNWPEAIRPEAELTISAMFALSDFEMENGATVVVPGSQALDPTVIRGTEVSADEVAYAEMPAGSAMIYTGKVVHGAGHNATSAWRYGMHTSFVVGWLRPEEASPLAIDRATAASLPERARELLGWGSYASEGGGRTWLVDFEDAGRLFD